MFYIKPKSRENIKKNKIRKEIKKLNEKALEAYQAGDIEANLRYCNDIHFLHQLLEELTGF